MSLEPSLSPVIAEFESQWSQTLEALKELVRIPSVSFPGFPPEQVRRSAEKVAEQMRASNLHNVELLEIPGTHPYVYGEWLGAGPDRPTLLLYAHHDVQPPGQTELWKTPPFEPTEAPGPGGQRLYARGAADDKAGVWIHLAAIRAFLKAKGALPVNVKLLIEGEEEIGSRHLGQFVAQYREKLQSDVLLLTDTSNWDSGVPALTVSLRGLVAVQIELKALKGKLHSGMWGGPIPDPAMALSKVLASLVDEKGEIAVPGVLDSVIAPTPAERKILEEMPVTEDEFRSQAGILAGVERLHPAQSLMERVWRRPSLVVNAIQASSRAQAGNVLNESAWARVSIRLVAGQDPDTILQALQKHIRSQVPWGLEASLEVDRGSGAWATEPTGRAFELAEKALHFGYGKKPLKIGCGGSIPFVKPMAEGLGGVPALLVGVEDPYTNAHGENESLLISDLKKACLSQIALFALFGDEKGCKVGPL